MWFSPTAQTPTRPWKVGRPVNPSRFVQDKVLRTEVTRPLGGGGVGPGPARLSRALISFCILAVFRAPLVRSQQLVLCTVAAVGMVLFFSFWFPWEGSAVFCSGG